MGAFATCDVTRRVGRCLAGAQDGAVSASLRLRCGAQACGPTAKLASFAALTALKQSAVSQILMRAARAGHKPSAPRRPIQRPCQAPPAAQPPAVAFRSHATPRSAKAWAGGRWRASAQPRSAGVPARARTRAHQHLTHGGCSSAANEVSVASSAVGPGLRASQGTPKGQAAKRHRPPAHAFARAETTTPNAAARHPCCK
jgi:hypothetical protein